METVLNEFGYKSVAIEVTQRCNMKCSFCALPIRKNNGKDMEVEKVFNILDELSRYEGIDFVQFHITGETLLYKDIWRCIDKSRQHRLVSWLFTNGLLLTDENVGLSMKHPPDHLRISLQVLDPALHMSARGINVPFDVYADRIASCLARLLDEEHSIGVVRADIAINDDRFFGIMGIPHRALNALGMVRRGDPTINSPNPEKLRPYLINFLQLIERKSKSFKLSLDEVDGNISKFYSNKSGSSNFETACTLNDRVSVTYKSFFNGRGIAYHYPVRTALCGNDILGILVDGTVVCCCRDYDGNTGIGNIFTESLASILKRNKEIFDGLRFTGRLHFDACKKCRGDRSKTGAMIKEIVNRLQIASTFRSADRKNPPCSD
jgi:MoaA/NifB/PqqE/SkfB family radical SAM enzyme